MNTYFQLKTVLWMRPLVQVWAIVILYVLTVLWCYFEYKTTGSIFQIYPYAITIFLAPIFEEIIFRGFLQPRLIKESGLLWWIAQTSLFFGIWHVKNIFFYPTMIGLREQMLFTWCVFWPIVGYLAYRWKTIRPGVIIHYVYNLVVGIRMWYFLH